MCERTSSSSTPCCSSTGSPDSRCGQSRTRLRRGQRVADLTTGRPGDQLDEHRRQGARRRLGAQRAAVDAGGHQERLVDDQRLVEQRQRVVHGQRQDAVAAQPRQVGGLQVAGHPAGLLPQPPRQRHRGQAVRAPVARRARPGRRWPPSSSPDPTPPTSPAIDENITNAESSRSRVNSCRFHAASTLARSTVSIRSGVSDVTTASSMHACRVEDRRQRVRMVDAAEHLGRARRGRRRRPRPPRRWRPPRSARRRVRLPQARPGRAATPAAGRARRGGRRRGGPPRRPPCRCRR